MAIIEDWELDFDMSEYPYKGAFYTTTVDESLPLDEQEETEVLVHETICDIQRTAKLHNANLLAANYTVYFPLELNPDATGTVDKYKDCGVRRGHIFRGVFYGYEIKGIVEIVRPSQLGAMSCDIKVNTENGKIA